MPKYLSGRVPRTPQSGITSDRYEFIGLEQTEPNLGDPIAPGGQGTSIWTTISIGFYRIESGRKILGSYWRRNNTRSN
jgi:hypothetical protein